VRYSPTAVFRSKAVCLAVATLLGLPCGQALAGNDLEVTQLSIEDLMNLEVTTVSRKAQRLTDTAAAAFVLTADDIQRSGANTIPDALRMVPGVEVARIGSGRWAVTARGFNGRFAAQLLVLIDGRSVYSPLYSGVFWEAEDVLLEDVDRIEVIRGPGASLWGANAVNGIINILTRSAKRTQGALVTAAVGNEDVASGAARWGGKLDEDTHLRLWAKSSDRKSSMDASGQRSSDAWRAERAGFRMDGDVSATAQWQLIGNTYQTHSGETLLIPQLTAPYATPLAASQSNRGTNLLGRYEWTFPGGSQGRLQAYVDQTLLDLPAVLNEDRTTVDIDFQHRFSLSASQDMIWGLGYRRTQDHLDTAGRTILTMRPNEAHLELLSAFVHDEITVVPDAWRVIAGAKLERNGYTGLEFQPNLRSVWNLTPTNTLWAAVSRAVRTPSRAERSADVVLGVIPPFSDGNPSPLPIQTHVQQNDHVESETVIAYELGYRTQLGAALSLDVAAFHNKLKDLRSGQSLGVVPVYTGLVPYLQYNSMTSNNLDGTSSGLELAADWHPSATWRLQASYTYMGISMSRNGDPANDGAAEMAEGTSPRHRVSLRSSLDLGTNQQLDAWVRRVGQLSYLNIAAYTALDLRYAWRVTPQLELSLAGQNLLKARHAEYISDYLPSVATEIPRSVYVKARWQF